MYAMRKWLLALTCVLLTSLSYAQNVYRIRADSVLIYNTCDTAELILENRTQDTLGFLYNKGKGRTEFRRLQLLKIGSSKLAIVGQDTIDLDFAQYGDSAYVLKARTLTLTGGSGISVTGGTQDLSANRIWTITNTGVTSVNGATGAVTVAPASGSGNYIQNQSTGDQPSSAFRITGTGRSNSQFQVVKDGSNSIASTFQLYNAAVTRGANIQLDASTNPGLNFWLHDGTTWQNRMLLAANGAVGIGTTSPIGGVHIVNNTTGVTLESTRAYATTSGGLYGAYNRGTPTAANQRLGGLIMGALTNGTELRPSSQIDVLTSAAWTNDTSQPSYMRFMTTPVGAKNPAERMRIAADGTVSINVIPALGTAGTNFLTSNAGVISSRTAEQVLSDIGAAPANASGNYIQNQSAVAQIANFSISGNGNVGTGLSSPLIFSNNSAGQLNLLGGATGTGSLRGGEIVLLGGSFGTTPGEILFRTGTGGSGAQQPERMRIDADGNVGIGTNNPASPLHVAGNATAAYFTSTNGTGSAIPHLRMQTSGLNRWVIGLQNAESSGNAGSDFRIIRYNDAGALVDAPLAISRSTGVLGLTEVPTIDGLPVWYTTNHPAGSAFTPTLTGANVLSTLTTNAAGHITALTTRALTLADIGAAPASASANYIQNQTASPQAAGFNISGTGTIAGGTLLLNNGTSNLLSINAIGLGAPTFTSRSVGSKISVWNAAPSATTAGWDIGMESNHMWFGLSTNANNVGFKWYGGTTQIGRLDGLGSLQLEGQGRFKGWYTANGTGIAAELGVANGIPILLGYDRTNAVYSPLQLSGGAGATAYTIKMDGTGYLFPNIANYGILGTDASGKLINVAANFTPDARTITLTAGTGISVTGGTQDLSANRTWTITNSGVTSFNGSAGAVTYAPTLQMVTTNGKITTDTIRVDSLSIGGIFQLAGNAGIRPSIWSNSTYMIMGDLSGNQHTYISAGNSGNVYIRQANNTATSQLVVPASGSPYIGTSASNLILTSTNHVPGSAFTPTLTGANVLSSLAVNSTGHVTSLATRALTAADISAAPASGSANYIQNQTATAQSASFNINGDASIGGGELNLTNTTANNLGFGNFGVGQPTYTSHSAGTKISLVSYVSSNNAGYNIGIEDSHIWFNVANYNSGLGWKFYGGDSVVARLDGTGNLKVTGTMQANAVIQTSLRSLKKDIQPFSASALKVFEKAQVRTFKFKADSTGKTRIGFIADEVPDEMAAPQRNGVDQSNTVALLVKAVQELTEQNKALRQEIKEIKEQLKNKGTQQ